MFPFSTSPISPGDGIHIARPGRPAEILINTYTAGRGHLNASIQGNWGQSSLIFGSLEPFYNVYFSNDWSFK